MNILHLDYDDLANPYAGGGQSKATYQINKILSKRHKITVITGNYPGAKHIQKDGIEYKRLGIGRWGVAVSILSYWFFLPFFVARHANNFDIIVEFFTAPFSASFVPFATTKPIIACPSFLHAKELSVKYHMPFHLIESFLMKRYSYYIALTEKMKEKILTIHPGAQTTIIPRGVEQKLFDQATTNSMFLLFLGRLDIYQKGLDLLLRAWSSISKRHTAFKLVLAGSGKHADEINLKKLVEELAIQDSVTFIGKVEGKEKVRLLSSCTAVVCPSRFETFGNVALETLTVGKPLVCFDIEGFAWIPKDNCLKVSEVNDQKLAEAIDTLLLNPKLQNAMVEHGKKFARDFSIESISQKYETYLSSILHHEI